MRAVSVWGCLDMLTNDPGFGGRTCTVNNTDNVYFCCNNTDFCNNVTLRLPRETSVTTTESSPSASPSAFTTGENGGDRIWENREKGRGTGRIEGFGGPNWLLQYVREGRTRRKECGMKMEGGRGGGDWTGRREQKM